MRTVIQVIPTENYQVYVYFSSGVVRLYDAKALVNKGVFSVLSDVDFFMNRCTVLNNTLAWDQSGSYDPYTCLDIDPGHVYAESIPVEDPLQRFA